MSAKAVILDIDFDKLSVNCQFITEESGNDNPILACTNKISELQKAFPTHKFVIKGNLEAELKHKHYFDTKHG